MLNKKLLPLIPALALLLFAGHGHGDDTEIYLTPPDPDAPVSQPQVLFYLEYASNLTSTLCTNVTLADIATSCAAIAPVSNYMAPSDLDDGTINLFELVRASLKRVLADLEGIDVGLMMAHADGSCTDGPDTDGCSDGGYMLHRMVEMDILPNNYVFDAASATPTEITDMLAISPNKYSLFNKLDGLRPPQGQINHAGQLKEVYFELFRYLTGQEVFNGHNGWNDFGTGPNDGFNLGEHETVPASKGDYVCLSGDCTVASGGGVYVGVNGTGPYDGDFMAMETDYDSNASTKEYINTHAFKWDDAAESGANYISPLKDCSKVFMINILDGKSADNDADPWISESLANGGMDNLAVNTGDEGLNQMVGWLHDKDLADGSISGVIQAGGAVVPVDLLDKQNVTSYFIAAGAQQLDSAAYAGGTGSGIELKEDAQGVVAAIEAIFNDVLSISTTFVAASIPVNVFNRSEVLDNTYLALFQPNDTGQPRWVGNLKKLKLEIYEECQEYDPNDASVCLESVNRLRLVGAATSGPTLSAIANDGRIKGTIRTFWSDPSGYDLYDDLNPDGDETGYTEVAGYDGRTVYRGGAAQQTPGFLDDTLDTTLTPSQYPAGAVSWTNDGTGRMLYTDIGGSLVDLDVNSMNDLMWQAMIDSSDSDYDTMHYWPSTLYTQIGSPADYTLDYNTDIALFTQDPTDATITGCTTSHRTAVTENQSECYSNKDFMLGDVMTNLLAYIRGLKVKFEDDSSLTAGDNRPLVSRRKVFGDPLHSRPLPVNYGATDGIDAATGYNADNPEIYILVGSNDGYLRMIKNTNADASESGEEVWAFMPSELLKKQKQLMDNAAEEGDDNLPLHPYGLDGSVSVYVYDTAPADANGNHIPNQVIQSSDGDKVWAFFGLRRGGKGYYALNLTDPDNPSFMWKVTPDITDFNELGYTFSQPVVRLLDWSDDDTINPKPVLIVGGGYDLNKDIEDYDNDATDDPGQNDSIGNTVYVIDAQTGDLVWKATHADMVDSIPSTITAIDGSGDGLVDQVYVGDTGGSVWRLDLFGTNTANWQTTKLLNLGRHATSSNNLFNDRRFFHAPDVVPAKDATGKFNAVVIGSGNRAHPLQKHTEDAMYMFKDRVISNPLPVGYTAREPDDLHDATDNCIQEVNVACAAEHNLGGLSEGWQLRYESDTNELTGEKSLASALTLDGVVYFNTYIPAGTANVNSCGPKEGNGRLYIVSLQDAVAVFDRDTTNTTTDPNTGEDVELQIEDRTGGLLKSGGIPSENVPVSFTDAEGRTYTGIIRPDLGAGEDLGKQQVRSYWMEKNK